MKLDQVEGINTSKIARKGEMVYPRDEQGIISPYEKTVRLDTKGNGILFLQRKLLSVAIF